MSSFCRQAIAALMVLLGLALLDIGPRASAAFWPALSSPSNCTGLSGADDTERNSDDRSTLVVPASDPYAILSAVLQQLNAANQGGAGAPTTASSTGAGAAPALGAIDSFQVTDFSPGAGLRLPEIHPGPSLLLTSIFEPPRVG